MIKILHISRTMGQGGAEKIVYQLCKSTKDVFQNIVVSSGGVYVSKLEMLGIKHYSIPDMDIKNPVVMLKCFYKIYNIIKKEHIDIVHTHHRMAAFYAQLIFYLKPELNLIYTAHNVFYNKRKLLKFALKNNIVVAVGKGVKENLSGFYKIPEYKIKIIYNSIDISEKSEGNSYPDIIDKLKLESKILIGNIGRLSKQKGIDIFVKAMENVVKKHPEVYGIIVGDGEDKKKLTELASTLGIKDNIIFLGYQSNVMMLIKQFDFVVLSSRWEGFPLVPIEAFSQRKTIVASDITGNNEIVQDNENGLLFENEKIWDLSKKIELLIINPNLRIKLEENAIECFERYYSYNSFKQRYLQLYQSYT